MAAAAASAAATFFWTAATAAAAAAELAEDEEADDGAGGAEVELAFGVRPAPELIGECCSARFAAGLEASPSVETGVTA